MDNKNKISDSADIFGIVLSGGSGQRFGSQKQFYRGIGNRYLFEFALTTAIEVLGEDKVILVFPENTEDGVQKYCKKKYKNVQVVYGGKNRLFSIMNALVALKNDPLFSPKSSYVALIDASRPLTRRDILRNMTDKAIAEKSNYVLTRQVTDFLAKKSGSDFIPVDRSEYVTTHTPHVYKFDSIYPVLSSSSLEKEVDSAILLKKHGEKVSEFEVTTTDFKVTFEHDIEILKKLLG